MSLALWRETVSVARGTASRRSASPVAKLQVVGLVVKTTCMVLDKGLGLSEPPFLAYRMKTGERAWVKHPLSLLP